MAIIPPNEAAAPAATGTTTVTPDAAPPQPKRPPTRRPPSVLKELVLLVMKIAIILTLFAITFTFVYGIHWVAGPHMSPMVNDGDLVVFFRLGRDYEIGDLTLVDFEGGRHVLRVIAQEGDRVDFTPHGLTVNGAHIHEPMIFQNTHRLETAVEFPLTVGAGEFFLLGDARETAIDSRAFGSVHGADTLGTVITVIRRRGM